MAGGRVGLGLFLLFFSYLAVPAYAAENWEDLATNVAGEDWYLKPDSVKKVSQDVMAVSIKRSLTKENEEKTKKAFGEDYGGGAYAIVDMQIDCSKNVYRMVKSTSFSNHGTLIAYDYSKSGWIANKSVEDIIRKKICK